MRILLLAGVAAACAAGASAQTTVPGALGTPDVPDSVIAVVDPVGAVPPLFDAAPQESEIFFGHDRESFSEVAITKLSVLASAARRTGAGSVAVVGHTDTSGDLRYNEALSIRRAAAIRRDLIARGVPSSAISVSARGQNDLAVQTGDGVREPANRRAVVTIDGAGAFPPPDDLAPVRFRLP